MLLTLAHIIINDFRSFLQRTKKDLLLVYLKEHFRDVMGINTKVQVRRIYLGKVYKNLHKFMGFARISVNLGNLPQAKDAEDGLLIEESPVNEDGWKDRINDTLKTLFNESFSDGNGNLGRFAVILLWIEKQIIYHHTKKQYNISSLWVDCLLYNIKYDCVLREWGDVEITQNDILM